MLSSKRFDALIDAYGADFRRWPEGVRGAGMARLAASRMARRRMAAAQALDEVLVARSAHERANVGPAEAQAAMTRLRAGLQAEMASGRLQTRSVAFTLSGLAPPSFDFRWMGVASACGLALAAGLWTGAAAPATAPSNPDALLAILQPSPIQVVSN